ncbi:MAG: tetratricopeptide repeat-containing glycosyltransferase family 2 protein [Solirubrobacteraceae bacterium]
MLLPASGSAVLDSPLAAIDLPARARRLLAVGDHEGYGELFERLPAIEDPHRRYWASARLLEHGLAASARCSTATASSQLLAILAAGVLGVLEHEPSEPVLLRCAGEIFGALGCADVAETMLDAAMRLDPGLERGPARPVRGIGRVPLHASVPLLAARARELAASARPARGLRLSLCMIVRDEQEMLPRCLAAVADGVDELVIVDTGSSDRTVEIARSYGARVIEQEWTGSFAQARNVSFDAAQGDWLMYLDADEVIVGEDASILRSLAGRTWREAFHVVETSFTGEGEAAVIHDALRIFRNRPEYRFEGRVHEQIAHRLPAFLPERVEGSGVRVEHYGYLGDVRARREKSTRNIRLLRLQQQEGPESAFLRYNLGAEHAAAGDALSALAELERSWELLKGKADLDRHEFAPALMSALVRTLRACGRPAEAFAQAQEGLARFPGFTDLVLEQAQACLALGQSAMATELFEQCIAMGDAPRRYAPGVGCGGYLPRVELAKLSAAGDPPGAVSLFEHCLGEHQQRAIRDLLELLETLLRAQAFEAFEALHGLLERAAPPERERRELLAEMYLRCGYLPAAAEEWMAVCREEPDGRALLGLARVAELRGMAREAEEFANAVLSNEPENRPAALLLERLAAAGGR